MSPPQRQPDTADVGELLHRLAAEEERFLQREFLAPSVRGSVAEVRIGGVVCRVRIEPRDFTGWGVFRPVSMTRARLVREAGLADRRRWLDLFPRVGLIVCRRHGSNWHGAAAHRGDARFRIEGLVPIEMAEEVQPFDVVAARFDGSSFWFDDLDPGGDPAAAAYLRGALQEQTAPEDLARPGLTPEQRAAYELGWWERIGPSGAEAGDGPEGAGAGRCGGRARPEPRPMEAEDPVRRRLRQSLSHAGAQLIGYLERPDSYRVTYRIGGEEFTSAVDKRDLTVQVAGVCLAGEDQKFDLGSLVGVLREGGPDDLFRVGDDGGMNEDDYWRVHPRRNP